SPDGRFIAVGSRLPTSTSVRDIHTGNEVFSFAHGGELQALAFSPDGHLLASLSTGEYLDPSVVKIWDMKSGQEVVAITKLAPDMRFLTFTSDGRSIAVGGGRVGTIALCDIFTGQVVQKLEEISMGFTFSPDGKYLETVNPSMEKFGFRGGV